MLDKYEKLKATFGKLPFLAGDLGNVDDAVYDLRDKFEMPGIKVLQFAFVDASAATPHLK